MQGEIIFDEQMYRIRVYKQILTSPLYFLSKPAFRIPQNAWKSWKLRFWDVSGALTKLRMVKTSIKCMSTNMDLSETGWDKFIGSQTMVVEGRDSGNFVKIITFWLFWGSSPSSKPSCAVVTHPNNLSHPVLEALTNIFWKSNRFFGITTLFSAPGAISHFWRILILVRSPLLNTQSSQGGSQIGRFSRVAHWKNHCGACLDCYWSVNRPCTRFEATWWSMISWNFQSVYKSSL